MAAANHHQHRSSKYLPNNQNHANIQRRHAPQEEQVGMQPQDDAGCFCCREQNNSTTSFRRDMTGSANLLAQEDSVIHAQELNELSPQERQRVLEEVHGVADFPDETEELLAASLEQFKEAVANLPPKTKRRALDRAVFYRPSILKDTAFHLLFLRADQYHAGKAAKRMAKYFEDKLVLFGEDKLVKKITLEDLDETDRKVLDSGFFMVLSNKDQTGRPIWFCDITKFDFNKGKSLIRCCWYQVMSTVLDDEDAQRKGICDVAYCPGDVSKRVSFASFSHVMQTGGDMLMNLPHRITGYHFCYNDPRLQYILTMACRAFGKAVRLRLRTHFGSHLEIRYSLMTFGIQCESLLRTTTCGKDSDEEVLEGGTGDNDNKCRVATSKHNKDNNISEAAKMHQRYVERRRHIEAREAEEIQSKKRTGFLLYPNPNDVLVGRGRPYREFSGNLRWGHLIDALLEKHYLSDDRFAKTCISMDVVKTVHERGGRFLSRTSDGWEILDDLTAREKTASGFRSRQLAAKAAATGGVSASTSSGRVKRVRYGSVEEGEGQTA